MFRACHLGNAMLQYTVIGNQSISVEGSDT